MLFYHNPLKGQEFFSISFESGIASNAITIISYAVSAIPNEGSDQQNAVFIRDITHRQMIHVSVHCLKCCVNFICYLVALLIHPSNNSKLEGFGVSLE